MSLKIIVGGHTLNQLQLDAIVPVMNRNMQKPMGLKKFEAACIQAMADSGCPLPAAPAVVAPRNERYAESVIKDRACDYDGIEIHGVRDLNEPNDPEGTCCEVDDEDPQFWSVYVHLKSGGVDCIGDFGTHALACEYAGDVFRTYGGWKVYDFSPPPFAGPDPKSKKVSKAPGMGM